MARGVFCTPGGRVSGHLAVGAQDAGAVGGLMGRSANEAPGLGALVPVVSRSPTYGTVRRLSWSCWSWSSGSWSSEGVAWIRARSSLATLLAAVSSHLSRAELPGDAVLVVALLSGSLSI